MLSKYGVVCSVLGLMICEVGFLVFAWGRNTEQFGLGAPDRDRSKKSPVKSVERKLGQFHVENATFPEAKSVIRATLFAEIDQDKESSFDEVFQKKKNRIHDAVVSVIRDASYREFEEPSLLTLKRKLRKAILNSVGDEHGGFDNVIISEFEILRL